MKAKLHGWVGLLGLVCPLLQVSSASGLTESQCCYRFVGQGGGVVFEYEYYANAQCQLLVPGTIAESVAAAVQAQACTSACGTVGTCGSNGWVLTNVEGNVTTAVFSAGVTGCNPVCPSPVISKPAAVHDTYPGGVPRPGTSTDSRDAETGRR
jgi:hypothetical protein